MSKLVKKDKTVSTPATPKPAAASVGDVLDVSFVAWGKANFDEEFKDPEARAILRAAYVAGAYTGAKLISDNSASFTAGAFEAHGEAITAAKTPAIAA